MEIPTDQKRRILLHDWKLDEIDLKFIGFFITIILAVATIWQGIDIATGFLGAILMAQVRDLYRSGTNSGKTNGGKV